MRGDFWDYVVRYGAGVVAIEAALLPWYVFGNTWEPSVPILCLAAIAAAIWFGGVEAALVATAVGALSGLYFFVFNDSSNFVSNQASRGLQYAIFAFVALVIIAMTYFIRRAHAEAASVSTQYGAILAGSPLAVVSIDAAGDVTSWNRAAERLFGWTQADAIGKPLPIVPNQRRLEFRAMLKRVMAGATLNGADVQWQKRDGVPVDLSLSAGPTTDDNGEAMGVMLVKSDATERRHIDETLRASETRYRSMVEEMTSGVLLVSPQGEILLSNDVACTMLGLSPDQLIGRSIRSPDWDYIHENGSDFPSERHPAMEAVATRRPAQAVLGVFRSSSQDRFWVLAAAVPDITNDGILRHVVVTLIDIEEVERTVQPPSQTPTSPAPAEPPASAPSVQAPAPAPGTDEAESTTSLPQAPEPTA
jgi:PAS domain S-box-containing protein